MIYHYTDRISCREIVASREITPGKKTLYKHMLGAFAPDAGPELEVGPLIWLTINPILDGTIATKLALAGWPVGMVGDLCRICLPDLYAGDIGLWEYTQAQGVDPDWWEWCIKTGVMVGSHYTTWRIATTPIPASDWLAVEVLAGYGEQGTTIWKPFK